MAEGGLDEWASWLCPHEDGKFCPPEGCPKSYGCARKHGWETGQPTPDGCLGRVPLPLPEPFQTALDTAKRNGAKVHPRIAALKNR
jgi:hypothetical protein